jgi:hypothetical protein
MAKNNFMAKLQKGKGAVIGGRNPHNSVIRTSSPSLNYIFGNGHGLPAGPDGAYTALMYGSARSGKTVATNMFAGQLHQDDPSAYVVKFNTEFRESGQADAAQQKMYGIDPERYIAFERNDPEIFDYIEYTLSDLVKEGMNLRLVIIDSLNMLVGRRASKEDSSIMTQQIGDNSLTIGEGLRRILPIQRACGFGLILTSHIRAQMDTKQRGSSAVVHTSYSTAIKPGVSFGALHFAEYYLYFQPDTSPDGKKNLLGEEFADKTREDMRGNNEATAHKIRVQMKDASCGPKGREALFTFDYKRGIINQYEEVYQLGLGQGIITKPNNVTHCYGDLSWKGKEACLIALRDDPALQVKIIEEIKKRDMAHLYPVEEKPKE